MARVIADLSKVETLAIIGPNGKQWEFVSMANRSMAENLAYQRVGDAFMALTAATRKRAPDLDDFISNYGILCAKLAQGVLSCDGKRPTDMEAIELVERGIVNHLIEFEANERRAKSGKTEENEANEVSSKLDDFDLDAYRKGFERPTETASEK